MEGKIPRALHFTRGQSVHAAAVVLLCDRKDPERWTPEFKVVERLFGDRAYEFESTYLFLVRRTYGAPVG